ncbi:M42 family metallopeptidase [Carnobacterium gallinarum]|uniref:M42 family metallopeptidase n=1 Tax=Carnobacterium gallinarum TaxID=2749 RepID=UPI00068D1740|nr:M20/M25/M40 family metallo-hydrolase [Carnobacterium gallinarum]
MPVTIKEKLRENLKILSQLNGGSGQEENLIRFIYREVKPYIDSIEIDCNGNIITTKVGEQAGPSLMLMAHMDEVGLVVKSILEDGFLLVDKVGGVPDNLLLGRKVSVGKQNIPGIIGTKPGHLQTPAEASRVPSITDCYIDLALPNRKAVEDLGITIGDQIIWQSEFMEMSDPDFIATKAVDDRINCGILIELIKNLKKTDFNGTLKAIFSVREEAGLYGAATAGHAHPTDYALVLDTIPAGDTPEINTEKELPIRLGQGPGFPIADGAHPVFFSFVHPAVRRLVEAQAKKINVSLQKCTILSGAYTTDAAKLAVTGSGIPTATLCVPRRYSHSPVELMNLNDAVDLYELVVSIIQTNGSYSLKFVEINE